MQNCESSRNYFQSVIPISDEIKEEDDLSSKSSTADDLSFSSNPSTSDMPSTSTSVCGFCGKSFLYKRNLDRHIRRKHKSIKSQSRRKVSFQYSNVLLVALSYLQCDQIWRNSSMLANWTFSIWQNTEPALAIFLLNKIIQTFGNTDHQYANRSDGK